MAYGGAHAAPSDGPFLRPSPYTAAGGTVPPVPDHVPRARLTRLERRIALSMLRIGGWRVRGALPDVPRAVVIVAPHSSNWDGIWIYCAAVAMGVRVRILGKESLFRIPMLGTVLRRYGGVPAATGEDAGTIADQWVEWLARHPHGWIGIAPEGTRKPVPRWRIGFWKIAQAADVPIVPIYLDYPDRVIGIMPAFAAGHDMHADIAELRGRYGPWRGKHHNVDG